MNTRIISQLRVPRQKRSSTRASTILVVFVGSIARAVPIAFCRFIVRAAFHHMCHVLPHLTTACRLFHVFLHLATACHVLPRPPTTACHVFHLRRVSLHLAAWPHFALKCTPCTRKCKVVPQKCLKCIKSTIQTLYPRHVSL